MVNNKEKRKGTKEGHIVIEILTFRCLTFGKAISEKLVPTDNYIVGDRKKPFSSTLLGSLVGAS